MIFPFPALSDTTAITIDSAKTEMLPNESRYLQQWNQINSCRLLSSIANKQKCVQPFIQSEGEILKPIQDLGALSLSAVSGKKCLQKEHYDYLT